MIRRQMTCLYRMPPLSNKPDNGNAYHDTPLIRWLVEQPEIREMIADHVRNSGLIKYDGEKYVPLASSPDEMGRLVRQRKEEKKKNRRASRANDVAPKAWAVAKNTGEYDYYHGIPFGKFWRAWQDEHDEPKSPITMRKWLDWSGEFEFLDGGKLLYMGAEAKAKRESIAQAAVEKIEGCLNACHDQGLTPTPANCIMAVDAFIVNPEIAAQQIKPFLERQSAYTVSRGVIVPTSKDNGAQDASGGQNQEVDNDF